MGTYTATNLNDTTPAAPSGGVNVKWQTDGAGNDSAYVAAFGGAGGTLHKTGNYNAAATDTGKLVQFDSSSAVTYTLLATPSSATWWVIVKNINTGVLTINRNAASIDGMSMDLTLAQGDSVAVYSNGSNYLTGLPRPQSIGVFVPGTGTNNQVCLYITLDRATIFPANAPNSYGNAVAAATGSTTYTFKKNGSSFATANFAGSATTATFTQASDAVFAAGDILEIDGPSTADSTLANFGFTLQGYRF